MLFLSNKDMMLWNIKIKIDLFKIYYELALLNVANDLYLHTCTHFLSALSVQKKRRNEIHSTARYLALYKINHKIILSCNFTNIILLQSSKRDYAKHGVKRYLSSKTAI